jgi:ribosomal protein S6--L-glutamate ligase
MKIIVLATNRELYSNKRLMEAGEKRGHDMRFINIRDCYMNITKNPEVHYRGGEVLTGYDAIIPRIRPALTFYGTAVVRQFNTMGLFCLNDSVAIARSRDKLRSLQMMCRKGISIPTTGFASSVEDTKSLIKMVGGAPLIIKLLEGTQGRGIVMAETNKAAESVINAFNSLDTHILVQEFIKEADGKDIRCFVVGNHVVAAMERKAPEGEFRANIHLGGTGREITLTAEEEELAVRANQVMGLEVSGVDIIRSATGPKILEVNSSPGLEGIEGVTGKDIAGLMIEHIERYISERRGKVIKPAD